MRLEDEITVVDLSTWPGQFDAACMFLAAVAYPESHRKRDSAIAAMRAVMFRLAKKHGNRAGTGAYQAALGLPSRDMGARMRLLEKRLHNRLESAEIFGDLLLKARPGIGAEPHSLNALAKRSSVGASRFKHEVWRRHEVLHLAFALHQVKLTWRDPARFGVVRLLANPQKWIGPAIDRAETLAGWRAHSAALPVALKTFGAAKLIRLARSTVRISQPPA